MSKFYFIESRLFTMAMEFWDEYSNNVIVIDVIERDSNVQLWLTQTLRGICRSRTKEIYLH
ncbi:MAG TPA: hypothetical protein VHG34_01905 [Nitrososphaeraceae archaeon]|nr:hypothetical protein [Nitrososphaeraceae archaeon]